jgi:hypothetical protein
MLGIFGSKAKEILESINGITLSEEDIAKFGDAVHDFSELHRKKEEAIKFGFKTTPVMGVHLASIGGRISRNVLASMRTPDQELYFTEQQATFRDPVYPGEPIIWRIGEEDQEEGSRSYRLVIPNEEPGKKPRVELHTKFSTERLTFTPLEQNKQVYSEEIEISPKEIKAFYECLREKPAKEVPFNLGTGRVPSTLLTFLRELNRVHGTQIGGKNIEMISRAYDELDAGKARVDVYEVEKRGKGNRVSYTFEGVLYQNYFPRVSAQVKTFTNGELDTKALR